MRKNSLLKLNIRKRTLPQYLTWFIFVMPFFLSLLLSFLGLPSLLKYTIDAAWIGLVMLAFTKRKLVIKRDILPHVVLVAIFFLYTLIMYCFHFQSLAYYLWGVRNNFRFYVAFFAFAAYFDEQDANDCLKFVDILFWVNAAVSLVQFFVLNYRQDHLGGIFGVDRGCNAYSIVLFSVVLIKSILRMMEGKESAFLCLVRCAVALGIAALAELKAFYLIFVLIFVTAAVFTRFSWKKCVVAVFSGLLVSLGVTILADLFGSNNFLSWNRIVELIFSKSYATTNDLGRLSAIPVISRTILTEPLDQIVGLGLGNCDTSTFAICNTPFYQAHSQLHYTWFSSAFLFLEIGYVGLLLYVLFFVITLILSLMKIRKGTGNALFCRISAIMSLICIVLVVYNSSLRMEVAYMAFFALALPYVRKQDDMMITN